MKEHFFQLAGIVGGTLARGDGYLVRYSGETSRFVRFNRAAIRQSGTVEQHYLSIELFRGRRHVSERLAISGSDGDRKLVLSASESLRELLSAAPEDPHFLINENVHSTARHGPDELPADDSVVPAILDSVAGLDFAGFYAAGPVRHGFANSLGQRNWSAVHSFNLDACLCLNGGKAVKLSYGASRWDGAVFRAKLAAAKAQFRILDRPSRNLPPGEYRAFLAPAAMEELLGMLGWGGFSLAAHRTGTTPLIRLARGEAAFNPLVTLIENTKEGFAPAFQDEGFIRPDHVPLIRDGRYEDCLASPRSAKEFQASQNGANADEAPVALEMASGSLAQPDILSALGTGLLIGNLWYLNYSDRNACRLTGMTRFATFWVENGEIAGPVSVMRFDDSVYRILGSNLIALTAEREWRLSTSTYDNRSTASMHIPGALIEGFRLTL